jgi:hypothetical protein
MALKKLMATKKIITTSEIYALYFVKHPYRSDLNFFAFDLDELRKELNKPGLTYTPEIYEVQFFMKKPIFKKYTLAQLKKLNIR